MISLHYRPPRDLKRNRDTSRRSQVMHARTKRHESQGSETDVSVWPRVPSISGVGWGAAAR